MLNLVSGKPGLPQTPFNWVGPNLPVWGPFGGGGSFGVETRECCDGDKKYREFFFAFRAGPSFGASVKLATQANLNIITSGNLPKCLNTPSEGLPQNVDVNIMPLNMNFSDEMTVGVAANMGVSARWNVWNKYKYWYREEIGSCCE